MYWVGKIAKGIQWMSEIPTISDFGRSTFVPVPDGLVFGQCSKLGHFCPDFLHFWTSEIWTSNRTNGTECSDFGHKSELNCSDFGQLGTKSFGLSTNCQ